MNFEITDTIEYPLEQVFRIHRDCLEELVEYLPNVDSITVESRQEDDGWIRLVNRWKGAKTEVPTLIRPFIKPELLEWVDRANWYEPDHKCEWELEFGFMGNAVTCKGVNTMRADERGHTVVKFNGDLSVDASKLPGVPKFMAGKISSTVEKFVVKMITPNLKKTNEGVKLYIQAGKG